ncbi:MAG: TIGR00730 family Rossman fold protein [Chlorobiaceae bacterium]|nr:TIGR00730 family Rossman fold protein [Chlorobiaceae bacterium]
MVDGWRVFKIMAEFVSGFETMSDAGPAVTVFGSTRVSQGTPEYLLAEKLGRLLAEAGFAVITGGGPGVMEAANKGAQSAGGVSIGFNIKLPNQQNPNQYIDQDKLVSFQYFFVRKVMFLKYAQAFIALPGGFGTLDEVSEAITLIQTGKSERFPVILMGRSYWDGFYRWVKETMLQEKGYISEEDLQFIYLEESPEAVVEIIKGFYPDGYALNF